MKWTRKWALSACLMGTSLSPLLANTTTEPIDTKVTVEQTLNQEDKIPQTVHELECLFVLMQERLSLMHDLSRYKWNNKQMDQTFEGEELALTEMGKENDAFIASFFEAQNNAALEVQKEDFAIFGQQKVGQLESVKDYETEIKPQLDAINKEMLETVNQLLVYTQNESLPSFLKEISYSSFQNEGIHRDIYNIAVDPLFQD